METISKKTVNEGFFDRTVTLWLIISAMFKGTYIILLFLLISTSAGANHLCLSLFSLPRTNESQLVQRLDNQAELALEQILYYEGQLNYDRISTYSFLIELKAEESPLTQEESATLGQHNGYLRIRFYEARKARLAEFARNNFVKWLTEHGFSDTVSVGEINPKNRTIRILTTFPEFMKVVNAKISEGPLDILNVSYYSAETPLSQRLGAWIKHQKSVGHIASEGEIQKKAFEIRRDLGIR